MAEVRVPQKDGEISIVRNGDLDDPTVYKVSKGVVNVDDNDVPHFLSVVDGSELVGGQRAAAALAETTEAAAT